MTKEIYYNAPCGLYKGFLNDETSRMRALQNVFDFVYFTEYQKHTDIQDEKERFEKVRATLDFENGYSDNEERFCRGQKLASLHIKEPYFSISRKAYVDFYNNYKSDEECAMLLAYLALSSICGNKQKWAKTNKAMWLSRMDGKSRPEYKKVKGKDELVLSDSLAKYRTNYGIRRLRALLFEYYHVAFYSKSVHGFCFSTTLTLSDLILMVKHEPSDTKRIDDKLKTATKKAEKVVEDVLKNTQNADSEDDTNELPF